MIILSKEQVLKLHASLIKATGGSDNKENARDEWEVLKEVARQFPDLGNGNLILLDENYVPFGKKNYMDSNYKPLNEEAAPK
jgi:hypothetical protein